MNAALIRIATAAFYLLCALPNWAQDGPRGHWSGSVEIPNQEPLAMEVDLDKTANGWIGSISIPAQNASGLQLDSISFTGSKCIFHIKSVPGDPTFTGTLSADGKTMTGDFTPGSDSFPFKFSRTGEPNVDVVNAAKFMASAGSDAQSASTAPANLEFDVASIRVSKSSHGRCGIDTEPGILRVRCVSLKMLLRTAFNLEWFQIEGPGWMDSATYDISAKASSLVGDEMLNEMQRTLLVKRFKVVMHTETRQHTVWALVVAKGGPRLTESLDGGEGRTEIKRRGPFQLTARRMSMEQLARYLSVRVNVPVFDKTGLKSRYDITLDWARVESATILPKGSNEGNSPETQSLSPNEANRDQHEQHLIAALQEQLGLKLESVRMAINVRIIDSATRVPTEN